MFSLPPQGSRGATLHFPQFHSLLHWGVNLFVRLFLAIECKLPKGMAPASSIYVSLPQPPAGTGWALTEWWLTGRLINRWLDTGICQRASSLEIFKENDRDTSEVECEQPAECKFPLDLKGISNHEAMLVNTAAIYWLPPWVRCFVHAISFNFYIPPETHIVSSHFTDGEIEVQRGLFTQSTIFITFMFCVEHSWPLGYNNDRTLYNPCPRKAYNLAGKGNIEEVRKIV